MGNLLYWAVVFLIATLPNAIWAGFFLRPFCGRIRQVQ